LLSIGSAHLPRGSHARGASPSLVAAARSSPLSSVYSPTSSSTVGGPAPGHAVPTSLEATISLSGSGGRQVSYMGVFVANYVPDGTTSSVASTGNYTASYRLGGNQTVGLIRSAETTASTGA